MGVSQHEGSPTIDEKARRRSIRLTSIGCCSVLTRHAGPRHFSALAVIASVEAFPCCNLGSIAPKWHLRSHVLPSCTAWQGEPSSKQQRIQRTLCVSFTIVARGRLNGEARPKHLGEDCGPCQGREYL